MLILKSILNENEQSMVAKFFKLQLQQPMKGDWVSMCRKDLNEMNIELTLDEIKTMPKESFLKIIKSKISEISLIIFQIKEDQKERKFLMKSQKWLII